MAEKGSPSTQNMVVGGGSRGGWFSFAKVRGLNRRKTILVSVVLLIIVAVVLVVWHPWSKPAPYPKHPTFAQYVDHQVSQSEQELKQAKTTDQKAKAYADLSNIYANKPGQKAKAIDYARKLVALKPTADSYSQLAFVLDANGQYQASADAYNKAASLSAKSGVVDDGRSGGNSYAEAAKQEEAKL